MGYVLKGFDWKTITNSSKTVIIFASFPITSSPDNPATNAQEGRKRLVHQFARHFQVEAGLGLRVKVVEWEPQETPRI